MPPKTTGREAAAALDERGAIVLRQKQSRGEVDARLANMPPPCFIGMEACVGPHHLGRRLKGKHGKTGQYLAATGRF